MRQILRVPVSEPEMEHAVEKIDEEGQHIVQVASDGAGSLFVLVEPKRAKRVAPGEKERR